MLYLAEYEHSIFQTNVCPNSLTPIFVQLLPRQVHETWKVYLEHSWGDDKEQ